MVKGKAKRQGMGTKLTQPFWWSICPYIIQSLKNETDLITLLPGNYSKINKQQHKQNCWRLYTHIYNRKTLKTTSLSNNSFTHLTNIYCVPIICRHWIQQWTKYTKIETKVLALSGAHSLVGAGEWNINNKENKWIKCLPCSIWI